MASRYTAPRLKYINRYLAIVTKANTNTYLTEYTTETAITKEKEKQKKLLVHGVFNISWPKSRYGDNGERTNNKAGGSYN